MEKLKEVLNTPFKNPLVLINFGVFALSLVCTTGILISWALA